MLLLVLHVLCVCCLLLVVCCVLFGVRRVCGVIVVCVGVAAAAADEIVLWL